MPKSIDIHTHYFPKENLEDILCSFKEDYWLNLLFPKEGKTLQSLPSQADFIADMNEANISKAVINGAYWQSLQACEYFNLKALEFAKAYPDRIVAMAIINPNYVKESLDFIKTARAKGFVGIGELCDSVQGFDILSDSFFEIVSLCQRENLPMCFHLSDEVGKNYKGKVLTNNDALFELAKAFPKQKFIFSHLAGGRAFRDKTLPDNVYIDCAAFPLLYKKELWAKLDFEKLKNICFATDYSLNLYPKTASKADFIRLKNEAKNSLDTKFHQDFFFKNAKSLFGKDL